MKNNKFIRTLAILFLALTFVLNQTVCLPLGVSADSQVVLPYGAVAIYDDHFSDGILPDTWTVSGNGEVTVDKDAIRVRGSEDGATTLNRSVDDASFLLNINGRLMMDVTLVVSPDSEVGIQVRGNGPRGILLSFKFENNKFRVDYREPDGTDANTYVEYTPGEPFRFCVDFEAGLDHNMRVWAGAPDNLETVITGKLTPAGYKNLSQFTISGKPGADFDILNYSILNLEEPLAENAALEHAFDELELSRLTSEDADDITEDLNLITDFMFGTKVSWESSDEDVITSEGVITRQSGIDAPATLTATLELNGNTLQKEFDVVVVRNLDSDQDIVDRLVETYLEMSRFTHEDPHRLTQDLNLLSEYRGAVIEWSCEPEVINPNGGITRSVQENVSATLTANISLGDCTVSKSFDITVHKEEFFDPMYVSDEVFFGKWDAENDCWEIESRINYDYSEKLLPVEERVKEGDYTGAKEEILQYYRDKAPAMAHSTSRNTTQANLLLDQIYVHGAGDHYFRDQQPVPLDYSHITFELPKGAVTQTETLVFMLMGREKDEGYAEFYSKEHGTNEAVLEVTVNGSPRTFPLVADSYIRAADDPYKSYSADDPDDYRKTNYGSSDVIEVKDSGVPFDSESRRGYLVFDTSSLKDTDVIGTGKITLYGRSVAPEPKVIMLFSAGTSIKWTEDNIQWGNVEGYIYSWNGINGGINWRPPYGSYVQWGYLYLYRMSLLHSLAAEYDATGDERYARAAIWNLWDFIVTHGNNTNSAGYVGGYPRTLCTGIRQDRIMPMFYTVVTSESMTADACTTFLKDFWNEANSLAPDECFSPTTNWGGSQAKGLYGIARAIPEFAASTQKTDDGINSPWLQLGIDRVEILMGNAVKDDGAYGESSSQYTRGQYNNNLTTYNMIARDGYEDAFSPEYMDRFKKFTYYLYELYTPSGENIMWGDTSAGTRADESNSTQVKLLNDPQLEYITSFGMKGQVPDHTSKIYDSMKTVFMRSGWTRNSLYAFTEATGDHGGHGHADDLHMTVGAYGRMLLCDSGNSAYIRDAYKNFIFSTRGHNTIEINGKNQAREAGVTEIQKGEIEEWITGDSFDFVKISTPNNPGFKHTRNILFIRPDYWIVSDYVTPEDKSAENTYCQFWRTLPDANSAMDIVSKSFYSNYEKGANIMVTPADAENIEAQVLEGYVNPPVTNEYVEYKKTVKGDVTYDTVLYPSSDGKKHAIGVTRLELSDAAPASEATALEISIVDEADQSAATTAYYYMAQEDKYKAERGFGDFKTDSALSYVQYNTQNKLSDIFIKGGSYIEDTKNGRFLVSGVKEADIGIQWEGNTLNVESTSEEPDVEGMQIYSDIAVQRVIINGKDVDYYQDDGIVYLTTSEGSSSSDQAAGNSKPPASDKKPGGSGGSGGSSVVPVTPVPENPPASEDKIIFEDVSSHWAKDDIEYLASKNIVNGYDGLFMPENEVTRAEFAAMIVRALELELSDYNNSFSDVKSDDWFAPYVQSAFDNGLISGYGEGVFGPSDLITREQAAKILVSALEKASGAVAEAVEPDFTDANHISDWALESVGKAAMAEILKGDDTGAFKPQNNASRAETAAMIRRLLARMQ